jgi:hypothetical protein
MAGSKAGHGEKKEVAYFEFEKALARAARQKTRTGGLVRQPALFLSGGRFTA